MTLKIIACLGANILETMNDIHLVTSIHGYELGYAISVCMVTFHLEGHIEKKTM